MQHELSIDDRRFRDAFYTCALTPAEFDHRAHVSRDADARMGHGRALLHEQHTAVCIG